MADFQGKVCAVTGAGSGIGRALAEELGARGARLALADLSEANLAATAAAIGGDPLTQVLDVSDREAVETFAAAVVDRYGVAHQIYNNAGISATASVLDSDLDLYDRVLGVNLMGVIHGTKAFLPHLIASGAGHVVNISSLNGYLAQPELSHYVTSKFAVRGFTESLRLEMEAAGHPVGVTVVHPGGVKTNIANAAMASARAEGREVTAEHERRLRLYNEKLLRMDPRRAARIILDGVQKGSPRVRVGHDAKAIDVLVRLMPVRYAAVLAAAQRRMGMT